MGLLVTVLGLLAVAVSAFVAVHLLELRRLRKIAAARPPMDLDAFRAAFPEAADTGVVVAVHAYFQEWVGPKIEAFPVHPEDDLSDVYGLVNGDLETEVEELLERLGRRLPEPPYPPIRTVRDLVDFLITCPPSRDRIVDDR